MASDERQAVVILGNPPFVGRSSASDTDPDGNSIDLSAAKRLRDAVTAAGGPTKVARAAGMPVGTLNRYLAGRDMRRTALVALAAATGSSLEWLAIGGDAPAGPDLVIDGPSGLIPVQAKHTAMPPGYVPIPRFAVAASAGAGALASSEHPQVVEYVAYAEDFIRNRLHRRGEDLGLIEAKGDSMQPTIHDGDVLTVDIRADQAIESGRLYVIAVGDNLLVKRVELRLTSVVLHSDNARYSPETIPASEVEQLHIVGQVLLVSAPPR